MVAVGKKPSSVSEGATDFVEAADPAALEAAESGWTWDAALSVLYVKVPSGTHMVTVHLSAL